MTDRWLVAGAAVLALTAMGPGRAHAKRKGKAAAAAPAEKGCGGIVLKDGAVSTGVPLPVTEKPDAKAGKCVEAVAAALGEYPGLRTVTVAVKLPDGQRVGGGALRIGEAYKAALVAAGVRGQRVSVVAPPIRRGEERTVSLAYTERRASKPVAIIEAASNQVRAGKRQSDLKEARRGATFPSNTYVGTGPDSSALVGLADGSRLKLDADSTVLLGAMYLNDDLKRVIKVKLIGGQVRADVRSGGDGSVFDVATRKAVAGVRGTAFRLRYTEDGGTRLETLSGEVELGQGGGDEGEEEGEKTVVKAGEGLTLDPQGKSLPRQELLQIPRVEGHLEGSLGKGARLTWSEVKDSRGFQLELARDAEFVYGFRVVDAETNEWAPGDKLPRGKWFWRVSAKDDKGYVGPPSKTYAFVLEP